MLGELGRSPEQCQTHREMIVESGIADRMLEEVRQEQSRVNGREIDFGLDECDFRVEKDKDPIPGIESFQVVIEIPNPDVENRERQPRVTQAFGVEKEKPFGAGGEPLTKEQFELVRRLAGA